MNFQNVLDLEDMIETKAQSFNENSQEIEVYLKTMNGQLDSFVNDVMADL